MVNTIFKDKVAIITGSSSGIGKAIALSFAVKGTKVVINGRDSDRLNNTELEIKQVTNEVLAVCCDVSTISGSKDLIDKTIEKFGKIDFLINNVGISMRGEMADLNPEVYKTIFESNVLGAVYPTIPAIKYIRETKGSIVFISSLAAIHGLPFLSAYSSSKLALRAIAESLRIEEAKNNIHVGLVLVGITEIEDHKQAVNFDGSMISLESRNNKKAQSREDVAKTVLKNISKRKFISVQTSLGKLNSFLHARFPLLVERILIKNIGKFNNFTK
jgi:short-subunit dehydrogenase